MKSSAVRGRTTEDREAVTRYAGGKRHGAAEGRDGWDEAPGRGAAMPAPGKDRKPAMHHSVGKDGKKINNGAVRI